MWYPSVHYVTQCQIIMIGIVVNYIWSEGSTHYLVYKSNIRNSCNFCTLWFMCCKHLHLEYILYTLYNKSKMVNEDIVSLIVDKGPGLYKTRFPGDDACRTVFASMKEELYYQNGTGNAGQKETCVTNIGYRRFRFGPFIVHRKCYFTVLFVLIVFCMCIVFYGVLAVIEYLCLPANRF